MDQKNVLTKILAIFGLALVWLPVLAPILFAVSRLAGDGIFRFDYLMPAELFLVAISGGVLLLWAALRARLHQKWIAGGLGVAVFMLVVGQLLAVTSGLASGETEPAGFWWVLVTASLVFYDLALVTIGIGGIRLWRELFKSS